WSRREGDRRHGPAASWNRVRRRRPPRTLADGRRRPPAPRPRRTISSSCPERLELLGAVGLEQGVDQLVEVALEDGRQPVKGEADPVIGHATLGEVVRPDALAALARPYLASPGRGDLGTLR